MATTLIMWSMKQQQRYVVEPEQRKVTNINERRKNEKM